jgi:hypothetical protein
MKLEHTRSKTMRNFRLWGGGEGGEEGARDLVEENESLALVKGACFRVWGLGFRV